MRHNDLPTIAVLAFLAYLTAVCLSSALFSSVRAEVEHALPLLIGLGGFIPIAFMTYYVFTGGCPISRDQINNALSRLRG